MSILPAYPQGNQLRKRVLSQKVHAAGNEEQQPPKKLQGPETTSPSLSRPGPQGPNTKWWHVPCHHDQGVQERRKLCPSWPWYPMTKVPTSPTLLNLDPRQKVQGRVSGSGPATSPGLWSQSELSSSQQRGTGPVLLVVSRADDTKMPPGNMNGDGPEM